MYTTQPKAEAAFFKLLNGPIKNVQKRLGDHLAVGTLKPQFGTVTPPSDTGHFDLFEFVGVDIAPAFSVVKKL